MRILCRSRNSRALARWRCLAGVFQIQWAQAADPALAAHVAEMFDRFKYGQEVASKTWLALVTLLTGLYFGKDFSLTPAKDRR